MISSLLTKALASAILKKLMKIILFKLMDELVKKSDNTIDDELVVSIKEALA